MKTITKAKNINQATGILRGILREKGEFTTDDLRAIAPEGKTVAGWAPHIKKRLDLDSEIIEPGLSRYFPKKEREKPLVERNPKEMDKLLRRIEILQTNNTKLTKENERITSESREWKHIAETSVHYLLNPEERSTVEILKKIFEAKR